MCELSPREMCDRQERCVCEERVFVGISMGELSSNVSEAGAYQGCRSSRGAREDWMSMARIMGVKGVMVMAF